MNALNEIENVSLNRDTKNLIKKKLSLLANFSTKSLNLYSLLVFAAALKGGMLLEQWRISKHKL